MHGLGSFTIRISYRDTPVCVCHLCTYSRFDVCKSSGRRFHDKQGGQMEKSSCLNPLAHTCGVVSGNTQTLPSTVTVVLSWEI